MAERERTWKLLHGEPPQYTKPETRIYLSHIPSKFTEGQLAVRLGRLYGPVQIHSFTHGDNDDSVAWVGFEEEESVRKAMEAGGTPKAAATQAPGEAPQGEASCEQESA